MYRCAVAALVAACVVAPAAAQTRSFPPDALRGTLVVAEDGQIVLNGRAGLLSPGSRVRNEPNMIVLPAALTPAVLVSPAAAQVQRAFPHNAMRGALVMS